MIFICIVYDLCFVPVNYDTYFVFISLRNWNLLLLYIIIITDLPCSRRWICPWSCVYKLVSLRTRGQHSGITRTLHYSRHSLHYTRQCWDISHCPGLSLLSIWDVFEYSSISYHSWHSQSHPQYYKSLWCRGRLGWRTLDLAGFLPVCSEAEGWLDHLDVQE